MFMALLETLSDHLRLPVGYEWAPTLATACTGLFGLLLIVRGARWAPVMAAVTFLALGGVGGAALSHEIATPLWPTAGLVGVGSFALGLVLFRFWQAALLAVCCMSAGVGVYYATSLHPAVEQWLAGPQTVELVSLESAGSVVGESGDTIGAQFLGLWQHLSANVSNFQPSFWSILGATGIAGLVFGWFLPRASRALWAASLGTLFLGTASAALLSRVNPAALEWLGAHTQFAWGITGTVWLTALAYNALSCRQKKSKVSTDDAAAAQPTPA